MSRDESQQSAEPPTGAPQEWQSPDVGPSAEQAAWSGVPPQYGAYFFPTDYTTGLFGA